MDSKTLIRAAFHDVFEEDAFSEAVIARYFHPDYIQTADGNQLNYQQFVAHMKQLKQAVHAVKIDFQHLIAEGNSVCSVHIASGKKSNDKLVSSKIIAYFEIKEDLIYRCDELSHLLEGDESDRDLASRH